jgi:O-antigen/teichoic acid export membrane protein
MDFASKRPLSLLGFLFRNGSHKQTILKNTLWLSIAEGIVAVANVFLVVYVIRVLGATEYGKFAYALSFVFLFSTLFDFGLSTAVIREFAGRPDEEKHFSAILTLKVLLGMGVVVLIAIATHFITADRLVRQVILVLCAYGFAQEGTNLFYALFRARQQMEIEAVFRVLQTLLLCLFVVVVLLYAPTVLNLSFAYAASAALALLAVLVLILRTHSALLRPAFDRSVWKKFLLIGFYLALAKGAGDITTYTDSVVLGSYGMVEQTGLYNAMIKITKLVHLPVGFLTAALFPTLIVLLKESNEKFTKYYRAWMKGTIFFSVLVLFVFLVEADKIILLVFSADFLPATTALKLLIVMSVMVFIYNVYYHILLMSGQQKKIFYTTLVGALINLIANILLIPKYGINGAAIATVATHFGTLCLYVVWSRKYTVVEPIEPGFILTLGAAVISGILMWWGVSAMSGLSLLVVLSAAAVMYSILFTGLSRIGQYLVQLVQRYSSAEVV